MAVDAETFGQQKSRKMETDETGRAGDVDAPHGMPFRSGTS
jgi:hypothetical protein